MLDYRMDTFLAVCESMHFTRAAEQLGLTQPAVSQHIHALEEHYGRKLFTYQGKKLALTPAGELLRDAARTMRHDESYLAQKLQTLGSTPRCLCFGATLTITEFLLPEYLAAYLLAHPERDLRVISANTQELLTGLDRGTLDFALVEGYFPRRDYGCLLCSQEPYVAVCARDDPLPASPCRLEDLLDRRLILREPGSGTRNILEKYLAARSLSIEDFPRRTEVGNLGAIKALVTQGCGITFLYQRAAQAELDAGTLRCIPLADLSITHDFSFIWRKDSIFASEYRQVFSDLLGRSLPAGEEPL